MQTVTAKDYSKFKNAELNTFYAWISIAKQFQNIIDIQGLNNLL